jgi:NADPH-dependent 2,4-dienoyl-CoA reductase/sulfur reductase-like enzyme
MTIQCLQFLLLALSTATSSAFFVNRPASLARIINVETHAPLPKNNNNGLAMSTSTQTTTETPVVDTENYEELSLPARSGRPLKVAIAGGGVGGLTAALCMLKKGFDVTVYEKTAAFARFGGPIQFASNALSVLKEIDDELFDRVMSKFTFTGTRACGIKDGT